MPAQGETGRVRRPATLTRRTWAPRSFSSNRVGYRLHTVHVFRVVAAAVVANVMALLPVFLLGALSVFIEKSLDLSPAELGAAVGSFFLGVCITSVPNGRLAERLGVRRALICFALASTVVFLLFAIANHGLVLLILLSGVAGAVGGFGQLAANLTLGRGVTGRALGLAFGISQSAIPAAAFLAGMAVPLYGVGESWRWAFAGSALFAVLFAIVSGPVTGRSTIVPLVVAPHVPATERPAKRRATVRTNSLLLVSLASMFGSIATIPVLTFLVSAAMNVGFSATNAGFMLASISALTIGVRVFLGAFAERMGRFHFGMIATMLGTGAIGTAWLATGNDDHTLFFFAALLALGIGNGWQGVLFYSIVHSNGNAPAAASAVVLAGGSLGAAVGPVVFGIVVETSSFGAAWVTTAVAAAIAAGFMVVAKNPGGRRPDAVGMVRP